MELTVSMPKSDCKNQQKGCNPICGDSKEMIRSRHWHGSHRLSAALLGAACGGAKVCGRAFLGQPGATQLIETCSPGDQLDTHQNCPTPVTYSIEEKTSAPNSLLY